MCSGCHQHSAQSNNCCPHWVDKHRPTAPRAQSCGGQGPNGGSIGVITGGGVAGIAPSSGATDPSVGNIAGFAGASGNNMTVGFKPAGHASSAGLTSSGNCGSGGFAGKSVCDIARPIPPSTVSTN
ncbi:unnamed protein product [Protopolystoma xenopodis]|uniref:Uncharacterized protein n=1 Tax=Protopolystoma xenopodis TaxID=117903 RepID=A0A3S5FH87_9PLAT|nr:unnamed protein product [Protopolystoma xenopodis]